MFITRKFSNKFFIFLIPITGSIALIILSLLLDFTNDLKHFDKHYELTSQELSNKKCRDWHNYEQIKRERERHGLGENGTAVFLIDPKEIEENERLYNTTGFSVIVSNKISVNRSIPDLRSVDCGELLYPTHLPKVSVIIIFHNEIMSVLLRTIHSVINRTPAELLHEIILVNDCSTNKELYEPLQKYVKKNFGKIVKIKNLKERKGLIVTRLEGANEATGEILVFFDSHIEVNINWLPPLIAPIKKNKRLATMPVIDNFEANTFEVGSAFPYGNRGGIDWNLIYHRFHRYLPPNINPLLPFPNPIMLGCAFAIDRKFFLDELGGYDREFKIWNGENYELSFKLWLCADGLYEVPCSRVAHSFRMVNPSRKFDDDYVGRNFKRLIEVWFDEFKDVVYKHDEERYKKIDAGDLSVPLAIKNRLNCKPFKYFLEEIAPDIAERYPFDKKSPVFASGQIKSFVRQDICIDTLLRSEFERIGLYQCADVKNEDEIPQTQFFRLNFMKNIVLGYFEYCLDSFMLSIPQCHYSEFGNQYWFYDHKNHMLINSFDDGGMCLTAKFEEQSIEMKECDEKDLNQKWIFTYENLTALNDWKNIYGYKKFVYGDKIINYDKLLPLKDDEYNF
ncbi:hypothetical protein PVAND_015438 [Polypedilum vanderplanki]|uniref:Polypeptide N-acetylgalactosaminyltransferase n=1 Tax=Polypedilum vanderplanki TaxID=319348 RepID=A0A9J6BCM0_POLVA|nr:hypothetical protein PVAND_015438 [Polypedilum vanderplanki]